MPNEYHGENGYSTESRPVNRSRSLGVRIVLFASAYVMCICSRRLGAHAQYMI